MPAEKRKLPHCHYRPPYLMEFDGQVVINEVGENWRVFSKWLRPSTHEIREQLISLRERLKWPRPLLAAFLGVPVATLRSWETGWRNPSGAAGRLIWLLEMLTSHSNQLKTGFDFILWGKGAELAELGKNLKSRIK